MEASARKRQRRLAMEAVEAAQVESAPWMQVTAHPTFFHARKGRRDDDNYIASLKGAYDGICDANLVVDDDSEHMTKMPPEFHIDRENPRVELMITRIE